MTDSKLKNVPLRVPESLHQPARVKIARLDTSFQVVLIDLLDRWVGDDKAATPRTIAKESKNDKYHQLLEQVLEHGDQQQRTVITQLLQAFTRGAEAAPAARTKKVG